MTHLPAVVIFDLDDTLIDTSAVFFKAHERFVQLMLRQGYSEPLVRETFDTTEHRNLHRYGYVSERNLVTMRETYEALVLANGCSFSDDILRRISLIGGRCLYSLPDPLPYAHELLRWCGARFRLALLTRGSEALQNSKIDKLGERNRFEKISVVEKKTSAVFKYLAGQLDCPPARCISIGDSVRFDVLDAIKVGMQAVHVHYPFPKIHWSHEQQSTRAEQRNTFFHAKDLREVRAIIEKML